MKGQKTVCRQWVARGLTGKALCSKGSDPDEEPGYTLLDNCVCRGSIDWGSPGLSFFSVVAERCFVDSLLEGNYRHTVTCIILKCD